MNETGPSLRSLGLWARREKECLNILERALLLLRLERNLPDNEAGLNRQLYWSLLAANRELYPDNEIAPIPECNNQPDPNDEARAAREFKRPDFQWIYIDRYELDPKRSSKQFVVECKRLGKPPRADWILNLNYVHHGVRRFQDVEWAYGSRFSSGAMIGYWQSMEPMQVLREVNEEAGKNSLPALVLSGAWGLESVSLLGHTFERLFEVSPFRLHHLWIDLRSHSEEKAE